MTLDEASIELHEKHRGKLGTKVLTPVTSKEELSLVYTPGVAAVSKAIAADKSKVNSLTIKKHTVAVVTDGSAVLGLGNIGPEAALPVMEGKSALFKTFADVDAFPICLATQNSEEIIKTVRLIAPVFGGINLEDIAAPRCFDIEDALQDLGIPVMHDDQHGTAVVVLAGLLNAAKVAHKNLKDMDIVISGAGAAGTAVTKILLPLVKNICVVDSKGLINKTRTDLDSYKHKLCLVTNNLSKTGGLAEALKGADVFIGVSKPGVLTKDMIKSMAKDPIVFALANPHPEIMPDDAKAAGAFIIATGRSDFPNQINNSLAFPGIFKGALNGGAKQITEAMKQSAAMAIASLVKEPTVDKIVPGPFEPNLANIVSEAVVKSIK